MVFEPFDTKGDRVQKKLGSDKFLKKPNVPKKKGRDFDILSIRIFGKFLQRAQTLYNVGMCR